ncbi:MAG: deoxyhypusine synthase [bacterium]|nr:deoxyhypusine synthase [bacterium]
MIPEGIPTVQDIVLDSSMTVKALIEQLYAAGGFTAKKLAEAAKILKEMIGDKNCIKFFSFPACIVATGCRGVIKELARRKLVDVIITTCGSWDHDIARSLGNYYHGSFELDDYELREKNLFRLGNVLVPQEVYGLAVERFMQGLLQELNKESISTYELSWEIGKRLDESSFLYWCWKNKIPVIVPGPYDGAVGFQLFMYQQTHKLQLDLYKDEKLLCDIIFSAKRTGALIIGGGISKHHTIWWNQFKDGLDYSIYITTAVEWDGSLSGARTREAVSWKKIAAHAKHITVEGDATVLLPLLVAYII